MEDGPVESIRKAMLELERKADRVPSGVKVSPDMWRSLLRDFHAKDTISLTDPAPPTVFGLKVVVDHSLAGMDWKLVNKP